MMKIGKAMKTLLAGSLTLTCLVSVGACGPGSSSSSDKNEVVSTNVSQGKYELRLWDGAGQKKIDNQLIAAFEKKHSNIKIAATYDPDNVSAQNGPRVISAADTPDIARITDVNSAVRGKHVINLDEYGKAYDWKLPDSQTEVYRVDKQGKLGSGSLYAMPDAVSMTGLFWNRKLGERIGMTQAPVTMGELEEAMGKAKDAGILPMMMPAKEGGTSYIYQALATNYGGRQALQDWIMQKNGAKFDTEASIKAAQKIKDWQDAGYFSQDALALDGSTALGRFSNGEALFFAAGSWYIDSIYKKLGTDVGWAAFPGEKADDPGSSAANSITAFGIPANAKNKNAAAAFLDFLQSDTARQIAVDNGFPPISEGKMPSTENKLLAEAIVAYEQVVKAGNTTDYINNATAGIQSSAIVPGFQSLIDGSMSPQQFVDSIQKQYRKEVK